MSRPDIGAIEKQIENYETYIDFYGAAEAGDSYEYVKDIKPLLAYIRELEAERKQLIADLAAKFILVPTETWKLVDEAQKIATEERQAQLKRIEHETAFKCAYLAWQFSLDEYTEKPERVICREYGINLDSLYAARWKDLEKK